MQTINGIDREMVTALRDRLPDDAQLRDFALRDFARRLRCYPNDVERALADLPAPPPAKLSPAERDRADLRRVAAERDTLARDGYAGLASDADAALLAAEPIVRQRELAAEARVILSSFKPPELPAVGTLRELQDDALAACACASARETLRAPIFDPPPPEPALRRILQDGERL